jgi:hypothetical protein
MPRVPSLAWFTRTRRFDELRGTTINWMNHHFELIERNAPWMSLAGQEVADLCVTSVESRQGQIPRDPPSVQCQRTVQKIYGVDGPLPERLTGLGPALYAAGWGAMAGPGTVGEMSDLGQRRPPVHIQAWRPVPGFGLPARLEKMPPARQWPSWRWLRMDIDWAEGGHLSGLTPGAASIERPRRHPALRRSLEYTAHSQESDPAANAFSGCQHEHEIAIQIQFTYYSNSNVNRPPGYMVKRLLPVRRFAGAGR